MPVLEAYGGDLWRMTFTTPPSALDAYNRDIGPRDLDLLRRDRIDGHRVIVRAIGEVSAAHAVLEDRHAVAAEPANDRPRGGWTHRDHRHARGAGDSGAERAVESDVQLGVTQDVAAADGVGGPRSATCPVTTVAASCNGDARIANDTESIPALTMSSRVSDS